MVLVISLVSVRYLLIREGSAGPRAGGQYKLFEADLPPCGTDTEIFIAVTTKTSSVSMTSVGKGRVPKGKYSLLE